MYKRRSFKGIYIAIIFLSIAVLIGLVYSAFTGQLNIRSGDVIGRTSSWDIHFENVSSITTTGTAKVLNNHQPTINSNNPTQIDDYSASLTSPGDTISFTFDVVNDGNYNAKITSINVGTPECSSTDTTSATNMCNNLTYSLKYSSGATVNTNDVLYAKDKLTFKVTLSFADITNPALLPKSDVAISNLGITINFEQQGDALVKDDGSIANYRVYHQGDKITLNNEDYHLINNSGAEKDYVVALKDLPLTVVEANLYGGVGTEHNHINRYTYYSQGTALSSSGYGIIAYYSSETCGYVNGSTVTTGCTTDYKDSDIKYVVDNWALAKFSNAELKEVNEYNARLITYEELVNDLGCTSDNCQNSSFDWLVFDGPYCWTMTQKQTNKVWLYNQAIGIWGSEGDIFNARNRFSSVRPVINIYKSALENNNSQ